MEAGIVFNEAQKLAGENGHIRRGHMSRRVWIAGDRLLNPGSQGPATVAGHREERLLSHGTAGRPGHNVIFHHPGVVQENAEDPHVTFSSQTREEMSVLQSSSPLLHAQRHILEEWVMGDISVNMSTRWRQRQQEANISPSPQFGNGRVEFGPNIIIRFVATNAEPNDCCVDDPYLLIAGKFAESAEEIGEQRDWPLGEDLVGETLKDVRVRNCGKLTQKLLDPLGMWVVGHYPT